MKNLLKKFYFKAYEKITGFFAKSDKRRVNIGLALVIASIVFEFIFTYSREGTNDVLSGFGSVFIAVVGVLGLAILFQDIEKVNRLLNRTAGEVILFGFMYVSLLITVYYLLEGIKGVAAYKLFLIFVFLIYMFWYVIRISIGILECLKKVVKYISDRMKGKRAKELEKQTTLFDSILKNTVSIAASIAVIYKFLEPLIKNLIDLLH